MLGCSFVVAGSDMLENRRVRLDMSVPLSVGFPTACVELVEVELGPAPALCPILNFLPFGAHESRISFSFNSLFVKLGGWRGLIAGGRKLHCRYRWYMYRTWAR